MRISDWSSDVCSSDLHRYRRSRHLLRDRPLPLCDGGGLAIRNVCRRLLLAAQMDRPHVRRKTGQVALLVQHDLVQHHLLPHPLPTSEEHTSELQSLMLTSYPVSCLKYITIQLAYSSPIPRPI